MTASTTIHQDFKIISNDIEGFSFQSGSLRADSGTSKSTTISQGGEARVLVSDTGAVTISTRENQNINLSASGSGKVTISGLDLTVYGDKKQMVTVNHDMGSQALTIITPSAGALTVQVSGETEGGSDAAACFLCAKRVGAPVICSAITSVPGTNGETLSLIWENNTVTLKVTGNFEGYANVSSAFNVRIFCSQ